MKILLLKISAFTVFFLIFALSLHALESENNTSGQPEQTGEQKDEIEMIDSDLFYFYGFDIQNKISVASHFSEDELVVGSTVASITPSDWNRLGAKKTFEALDNQLGLVNYTGITFKYNPRIRGLEGAFSVLIDGVPMNSYSYGQHNEVIPNWNLGTLSSIEMIKGPGSPLYGSDAFHGVISMKTFESDKDHYSVELGGGYPLYYDGNVKASQGIYDNFIRFDISGAASNQGDKKIEEKYDDLDDPLSYPPSKGTFERSDSNNSQSAVLKTTIKPADKLKIKIGGYFNRFDGEGGYAGYYYPFPLYFRDTVNKAKTLLKMGTASVSMNLPEKIELEVNGYYWEAEYKNTFVPGKYLQDVIYLLSDNVPVYTGGIPVSKGQWFETNTNIRSGANLIIKQPENAINLQWVLGYSFSYMGVPDTAFKLKDGTTGDEIPFRFIESTDFGKLAFEGESRKINSAFAQFKWALLQNSLFLLAGGRLDNYPKLGSHLTPRGGIIFLPTEKSSVKALYARAFKAPTAGQLTAEPFDLGNKDLKPEIIDTYELIYILKSKDFKLEANGYFSYWKEGIAPVPNPDTTSTTRYIIVNKQKQQAYGGEIRGNYQISPFAFDIGFAYSKSYLLDIPDPKDNTKTTDHEIQSYPTYMIIAGLYYSLKSLGIDFYLNNRIYLDWYTDWWYGQTGEVEKFPTYYRLDFNVTKIIEDKLSVSLNVNNILNRRNANPEADPNGTANEPGIYTLLRVNYKF